MAVSRLGEVDAIERVLADADPFSSLPVAERQALARALVPQRFSAGELVFSEGQSAAESWLIISGAVRIMAYYGDDRLMQIERLGRGQLFGLFCRLPGRARSHQCSAIADEALVAARLPDELWERCLESFPRFSRRSCVVCAARLAHMRRLIPLDRESVEHRLARALMRLYRAQGPRVAATRQSLALQAGTALETIFRVLARFRRRGWIETSRGALLIKEPAALAATLAGKRRKSP